MIYYNIFDIFCQDVSLCYNGWMNNWQSKQKKQVLTVAALICDDSGERVKAFVARRAANRRFLPGVYELPGGHVHYGEEMKSALERITRERLHVEITVDRPFFVFDYLNSKAHQHVAEIVYLARLRDHKPREIMLTRSKHSESLWVSLEMMERYLADMKTYSPHEYQAVLEGLVLAEKGRLER